MSETVTPSLPTLRSNCTVTSQPLTGSAPVCRGKPLPLCPAAGLTVTPDSEQRQACLRPSGDLHTVKYSQEPHLVSNMTFLIAKTAK